MNKSNLDLINLKNCISTLKNCPKDYKASDSEIMKEYIDDACIKRYEYNQVKALVILGMIDDLVEDCEFLYKKLQDKMEK